MHLFITDSEEEVSIDTYKISLDNFANKEFHPYIASRSWETIRIEVSDNTPTNIIRQLLPLGTVKPVLEDRENISVKQMGILREIFPDSSAALYRNFISNKAEFYKLVNSLL